MGEHTIPREQLEYPRTLLLPLREISDVHPAVLKMHSKFQPEPFVRLQALGSGVISEILEVPCIHVVPNPEGNDYWVWGGLRFYWRLVDYGWKEEVKVLDYGPEIPKTQIVRLAKANWLCTPIISGPNRESDWALAQNWEANSGNICKPFKSGKRRIGGGRNVFAKLSGLDPRPLRADKYSKGADFRPSSGTSDRHWVRVVEQVAIGSRIYTSAAQSPYQVTLHHEAKAAGISLADLQELLAVTNADPDLIAFPTACKTILWIFHLIKKVWKVEPKDWGLDRLARVACWVVVSRKKLAGAVGGDFDPHGITGNAMYGKGVDRHPLYSMLQSIHIGDAAQRRRFRLLQAHLLTGVISSLHRKYPSSSDWNQMIEDYEAHTESTEWK